MIFAPSLQVASHLENADTMGERIGRIGRIRTDFFFFLLGYQTEIAKKKSVRIRPIRPIRSPIVSHCITLYHVVSRCITLYHVVSRCITKRVYLCELCVKKIAFDNKNIFTIHIFTTKFKQLKICFREKP
jgi:hypothetical protein